MSSTVGEATRRVARYGWAPLAALAMTVAVESGERLSLSQAEEGIRGEFGVSDAAVGFLPFGMAMVGVLAAFPFGVLADRARRTFLLAGAMAIWAVSMGLNGFATTFAMLVVFRMGVGMVEANGPAAMSLIADYYPARDRARFIGIYQSGALVGAMIGLGIGGVVVDTAGWRWAFWMWVPFGVVAAILMLRQPEPRRGEQDADFASYATTPTVDVAALVGATGLVPPEPTRTTDIDYLRASPREVLRELLRIRSMWYGVMALTISNLLLNGLQFWGIPYFKRVHDLSASSAGAATALLGAGSALGILGGGILADRLLRRGVLSARIYVVAFGSIGATAVFLPALASTSLAVTAPLMFIGGALLTLPVAPAEALVSDVVVAQLRGRAATVRSVVRSLSHAGPPLIGLLSTQLEGGGTSSADALRYALLAFTPLYAIGGALMLLATRHYPADVAFVVAASQREVAEEPLDQEPPARA